MGHSKHFILVPFSQFLTKSKRVIWRETVLLSFLFFCHQISPSKGAASKGTWVSLSTLRSGHKNKISSL